MKFLILTYTVLFWSLHAAEGVREQFKIRIVSEATASIAGQPLQITGETTFTYARQVLKNKVNIYDVASELRLHQNGQLIRNSKMDRDGIIFKDVDTERTRITKQALPSTQAEIYERYDKPFVTILRDEHSREIKREYSALKGHQPPDETLADTCQLFHPAFPPEKSWSQDARLMGAKGKLDFVKLAQMESGNWKVSVTGTLVNPNKEMFGVAIGKETYVCKGEFTYSPIIKDCVQGSLAINVQSRSNENSQVIHTMDGTMNLTLEAPARHP